MTNKPLMIGSIMLAAILLFSLIGPLIPSVQEGIKEQRMVFVDSTTYERAPFPPSLTYPFGSDQDGKDILSLIIIGAKDTLLLIFSITAIRYLAAILLTFLGLNKKSPFRLLIYGLNGFAASLPIIFAAILFITMPMFTFSPNRIIWVIIFLSLTDVGRVAYIIQQTMSSISHSQFVEAGVTVGNTSIGMFTRYYLPNLLPEIMVQFFMDLGKVALLLGQLGIFSIFVSQVFVQTGYGFGELQNTSMNWSTLLGMARSDILKGFWIPFFPALALTLVIFTFNFIGEGLRQHYNRG
ncbi:ABC transporter permease [Bacillus sp. UMB0893]|uniref:ABC transporter permease n=1 Tax=Bacillus sp. UMB0893 TaxID=2066053 RepID=UPI0015DE3DDA|nr:ABC transporter permease subunit [Bacillus sp. UMB0893]